jgi:hypothetical protein
MKDDLVHAPAETDQPRSGQPDAEAMTWTGEDGVKYARCKTEASDLRARIAELEMALKPFAAITVHKSVRDIEGFGLRRAYAKIDFTAADLRRARSALENQP